MSDTESQGFGLRSASPRCAPFGLALLRLGLGGPVEAIAGAEGAALGAKQDHMHFGIRIGGVDRRRELVAEGGCDGVVGIGSAEDDRAHGFRRLGAESLHAVLLRKPSALSRRAGDVELVGYRLS